MAGKNKAQETIDAAQRKLAAAQKRAREAAANIKAMSMEYMADAVAVASTAIAAGLAGYLGSDYAIFGLSPDLLIGLPLTLVGMGLAAAGMGEIGRFVHKAGLGLVTAYVFRKAYIAGWGANKGNEGRQAQIAGEPAAPPLNVIDVNAGWQHAQPAYR